MSRWASLRGRIVALAREAGSAVGVEERIAKADADAADLKVKIAAEIERRAASPDDAPAPAVDLAKMSATDPITRALVQAVRTQREDRP